MMPLVVVYSWILLGMGSFLVRFFVFMIPVLLLMVLFRTLSRFSF